MFLMKIEDYFWKQSIFTNVYAFVGINKVFFKVSKFHLICIQYSLKKKPTPWNSFNIIYAKEFFSS